MSCFLTQFSCGTTQSHQLGIMTIIAECFLLCNVLLVFVHVWYIMRSFLMFSYLLVYFLHYVMVKTKKNAVICVLCMAGSFEILLNV